MRLTRPRRTLFVTSLVGVCLSLLLLSALVSARRDEFRSAIPATERCSAAADATPTPVRQPTTPATETRPPVTKPSPHPSPTPVFPPFDTTPGSYCELKSTPQVGPGIVIDKIIPAQGQTYSDANDSIPLIVNAYDQDHLWQSCRCVPPGAAPATKLIDIADPVTYKWTLKKGGGRLDAGGPATLYMPPDLKIGETESAEIELEIKDSRANDSPIKILFVINAKRDEERKYSRDVQYPTVPAPATPTVITGAANNCSPGQEKWIAVPEALTGSALDEIKLCVGQRVVVRASGSDTDTLELICEGIRGCRARGEKLPLIDEMKYLWTTNIGGFPDYSGEVKTNGSSTSIVYKAPDKPGRGTIDVTIQDEGKQGADAAIKKTIAVTVFKVDLKIANASDDLPVNEAEEESVGAFAVANLNDTDGDGIEDNSDKDVVATGNNRDEGDLIPITIETPTPDLGGTVKLVITGHGTNAPQTRLWTKSTKGLEETKREWPTSELPKTLYLEGLDHSQSLRDIELKLQYEGCEDRARATFVWAKQTGVWHELGDKLPEILVLGGGRVAESRHAEVLYLLTLYGGTGLRPISDEGMRNVILMEFQVFPTGIGNEPRVKFDISRQADVKTWTDFGIGRPAMHHLNILPKEDEQPNDDSNDIDESTAPDSNDRIYSLDPPGPNVSVAFGDRLRYLGNFREFVRVRFARRRPTGNNVEGSRCSAKFDWHVRHSLVEDNGYWKRIDGPPETLQNDIGPGHITLE